MKATGIVRKIDDLGRIVIPKELRRTMGIDEKDALEIFVEENGKIILKQYSPGCVFCDNVEDLTEIKGNMVCDECIEDINNN